MKKLIVTLLSVFMLWTPVMYAQTTLTLSGTVVDEKGETMPGVSVYLKDKPGVGTITDIDGKFSLKAAKGDVIIFSFIGYENVEQYVTAAETGMKITMKPSAIQLEETVITGMGATQRKVSVVGAITSVDVKTLQTPGVSVNNMLGGRVPGIITMQTSGEPGDDISEFWVRGIGTFGANASALVLIDGLEGTLSQIDPADIESFSVLKDASATAVYGVRGANGVILVTTKRGDEGKLQITGRANFTVSHLTRLPEYIGAYDYALLANEARAVRDDLPVYSDLELTLIRKNLDPDLYPNVNWQRETLKSTSFKRSYYSSMRGGGKVARYFVSLGLSNEPAAYRHDSSSDYGTESGYSKYTFRSNVDIDLTKHTNVYFGTEGFYSKNRQPGMASTDYLWQAQALLTPLTIPIVYSTGEIPSYGTGNNQFSPYVMINHTGARTTEESNLQATLALKEDLSWLIEGLKFKIQGAYTSTTNFNESRYARPDMYYAQGRKIDGSLDLIKRISAQQTTYSYSQDQFRKFFLESTLTYEEKLLDDQHRISGLLYYYASDQKRASDVSSYSTYLPASLAALPIRYQGVSGRITYGFRDTYMIDVNFGYTGSENFQQGRQYGFFPSMAVGWIPTQYDLVRDNLKWLNFLKFRFSYGSVGNDRISGNRRFAYLTTFNQNSSAAWGGTYGISENIVGADNLEWEKAIKSDLGIEATLFDQRFSLTVDFFNDQRDGIFQQRTQVPDYIGAVNMPYGNVGKMRSYGSDGNVSYMQPINRDMSFTLRANYTYSRNEIQNWEQAEQRYPYQYYVGWPNGATRGLKSLGLFRDEADVAASATQFGTVLPGDIKYKDVNADGLIDAYDTVPLSLTNNYPTLMYGFGGEFTWKDLTIGILFKGTGKTDYYHVGITDSRLGGSNGVGFVPFIGGETGNVLTMAADQKNRWTPASYSGDPATENPNAIFPRLTYGNNSNNYRLSDFWKRDARYLKLQEISIGYNLKHKQLQEWGIRSVELQLVGTNLYSWDNVNIFHAEQAWRNGVIYPTPAQYAFQLYIHL
ncbi:MAG: TonB-dependent receptor [Bacteroidales bacterium]|jgi:TonB-linked SusC/RagA family outer membrane protein|nr:TonB-dependent receptor [Bacteroidales bacterium]